MQFHVLYIAYQSATILKTLGWVRYVHGTLGAKPNAITDGAGLVRK